MSAQSDPPTGISPHNESSSDEQTGAQIDVAEQANNADSTSSPAYRNDPSFPTVNTEQPSQLSTFQINHARIIQLRVQRIRELRAERGELINQVELNLEGIQQPTAAGVLGLYARWMRLDNEILQLEAETLNEQRLIDEQRNRQQDQHTPH
ncbi:hypothetical protein GCK72_022793 [Caenorhabditis remanei]|uniref:Uncharacterized protein n=1 Tax=Caenorhabditis remanei TaxID=31234 RepID=A0A6A5FUN3_CAERE|nr:hypothetical protein GCK72_022793 [Caenorhabditis remanei]KAF1746340.1 hypothetical protein GCK72_022793 [Caenorhabditis remanei]